MILGEVLVQKAPTLPALRLAIARSMPVDPADVGLATRPEKLNPSFRVPVVVHGIEGDFELLVEFCLAPDNQPQDVVGMLTRLSRELGTGLATFQESDDPYEVALFESDGRVASGSFDPDALDRDEYRLEST